MGTFTERVQLGDSYRDKTLQNLKIQIPENFSYIINPKKKDDVEGDIIVYCNGHEIAGIDCKKSFQISLKSIANFKGFKTSIAHRALYLSPYFLINNTESFQIYVFGKFYQIFKDHNLNRLSFQSVVEFVTAYYHDKELPNDNIFIRMDSYDIGIDVRLIDKHYILLEGDWLNDVRVLRKFLKN